MSDKHYSTALLLLVFGFMVVSGVLGWEYTKLEERNDQYRETIEKRNGEIVILQQENEEIRDSAQRAHEAFEQEQEKNAELKKLNEQLVKQVEKLEKDVKVSMSNHIYFAKDSFTAQATAYTMRDEEGTADGITYTETRVQEGRTIAVDPKKIPLGSLVYIESKSPLVGGLYIAEDIGGAIDGNKIDIYMDSISNAFKFGRQDIKVTVLEERGL